MHCLRVGLSSFLGIYDPLMSSIKDELSKIQEIELQDEAAEVGSWESNFMKLLNWFSMGSAEPSEITEPTKRRQNKDVFGNSMSSFYNH